MAVFFWLNHYMKKGLDRLQKLLEVLKKHLEVFPKHLEVLKHLEVFQNI
jgi:hypothetical protein